MIAAASGQSDRAERLTRATPEAIWQAWADPAALARWMPPTGLPISLAQCAAFTETPPQTMTPKDKR